MVKPGHVGTIYQASNATYLGRGTARTLVLLPDGTVLNARAISKVRAQERGHAHVERALLPFGAHPREVRDSPGWWLERALAEIGARTLRHHANHRFAFVLAAPGHRHGQVPLGLGAILHPKRADAA